MALTAILYDFQIALSNVDRGVEQQLSLQARPPPLRGDGAGVAQGAGLLLAVGRAARFRPGPLLIPTRRISRRATTPTWSPAGCGWARPTPRSCRQAVDQNAQRARWRCSSRATSACRAFFAEGAAAKATRLVKAEFAALDAGFLARAGRAGRAPVQADRHAHRRSLLRGLRRRRRSTGRWSAAPSGPSPTFAP